MKLIDANIAIGNILLDKENPRFMIKPGDTQEDIKTKIMNSRDAKTLLESMKEEIRWVNRIVVRRYDNKYIVVEGNNRLACLKSGEIIGYNENTEIPVLVAEREVDETDEAYEESIKITQGIANVMVVKQWPAVSKARHLHQLFWQKKSINPSEPEVNIIRQISKSLGTSNKEVRDAVKRFAFYNEISKESDTLEENQWSYLEGIDKNETTRKFFGFDDRTYKFEWNDCDELDIGDEMQVKKDRLNNIPKLIKKESINSQQFRDKFCKLVTNSDDDAKFYDLIEDRITWSNVDNSDINDKSVWINKLNNAVNIIAGFPNQEDWASDEDIKKVIIKLRIRVEKQLQIIDHGREDNED